MHHALAEQTAEHPLPAGRELVQVVQIERSGVRRLARPGQGGFLLRGVGRAVEGHEGALGAGAGVVDALGKEGLAAAHLAVDQDGLPGFGKGAGQLYQAGHLPAGVVHVFKPAVSQIALKPVALPQSPLSLALHLLHLIEGKYHALPGVPVRHGGGIGHHVHPRHVEHGEVELPPLGQRVGPELGVLPGHQRGKRESHQLLPLLLQDLTGHVVALDDDSPGVQLQNPVEGVVQQNLQVGRVAALGVGDLPHVAGVEQAGAQGVLRPVEKEGALAQPAAVGIDKVAAQNDIHPVGHRLLRPALHLRQAGDKIGMQLYVENLLKALNIPHHVGDGHHADLRPLQMGDQAAGPVEQPGDLQAGELDLHHREVGVLLENGRLAASGHQDVGACAPTILHEV